MSLPEQTSLINNKMLVTMRLNNQRFGIPVHHVRDILRDQRIAIIPKAPDDIAGSINLRGRIVTVINLRNRLNLTSDYSERPMFIVVDFKGEYFSLLVDKVNEVLTIDSSHIETNPANIDANWREVSSGIYPLEGELLVILDINKLLET